MAELTGAKKVRVEGTVYCLTHACVHDDSLDPYSNGSNTCLEGWGDRRPGKTEVHRPLYAALRKGDSVEGETVG